jgi:hypothetical protein
MDTSKPTNIRVFRSVAHAVQASRAASDIVEVIVKNDASSEENTTITHREKM